MNINRFSLARQAQRVIRCHTEPTRHIQSVGEHTFGVLCLVMELTNGNPSPELVKAALHHDIPEAITGDIPSPAMWRSEALRAGAAVLEDEILEKYALTSASELSKTDLRILRIADLLELVMFSVEEAERGDVTSLNRAGRAWDALWTRYLGFEGGDIRKTTISGKFANDTEKEVIGWIEHRYEMAGRHYERGR